VRRGSAIIMVALGLLLSGGALPSADAAASRPSFIQIENDLMCVACHESLAVAQSPEAASERQYVRDLIAQGETKAQIEKAMVASYTAAVLAVPPAHGFNLLVYVIPPALLALGVATVMLTLPRWRRRTRAAAAAQPATPAPALDATDARRLDEELGRFA
jgi:cytochrome c-type biogenesis protein CcmH/NrfF